MTQKDNGGHDDLACDSYVYPGDRYARSGVKSGYGMGMSLRDWFAGQALMAYLRNPLLTGDPADVAHDAYQVPDAMIAARVQQ